MLFETKEMLLNNSFEILINWAILKEYRRKLNMSYNLIILFPMFSLHFFQRYPFFVSYVFSALLLPKLSVVPKSYRI